MLLLARNPRAAERDAPSTKPARDYPTPKWSISPISPQVVATNRLDQAQRSIGPLPIMGRTLPITMEEPTEEVGDRRDQDSDRTVADRERGPHKRENDPEQAVIGMIGWFWGDDILLTLSPPVRRSGAKVEGSQAGVKWEEDQKRRTRRPHGRPGSMPTMPSRQPAE
jgi:hypothetical protein